eukprot:TRINITY_DN10238_c0_g1_i2.p1 TRINITY_DN10238_c0_g1~~TRINITY_DN10238_c0_g1_i2.p1  ORF type:complete len:314 (+),score=15.31 TRINITY_DN10238_c0_g1_i2:1-942(+)
MPQHFVDADGITIAKWERGLDLSSEERVVPPYQDEVRPPPFLLDAPFQHDARALDCDDDDDDHDEPSGSEEDGRQLPLLHPSPSPSASSPTASSTSTTDVDITTRSDAPSKPKKRKGLTSEEQQMLRTTNDQLFDDFFHVHSGKLGDAHCRGTAAGVRLGGSYVRGRRVTRIKVQSYSLGFLKRYRPSNVSRVAWNRREKHYCSSTLDPHVARLRKVHVQRNPKLAAGQLCFTSRRPQVRLAGSAYTAVDINISFRTFVHKDKFDWVGGYSMLVALYRGFHCGGYFLLPEFNRVALVAYTGTKAVLHSEYVEE